MLFFPRASWNQLKLIFGGAYPVRSIVLGSLSAAVEPGAVAPVGGFISTPFWHLFLTLCHLLELKALCQGLPKDSATTHMAPRGLIQGWPVSGSSRSCSCSAEEQPIVVFAEGPWLCSSLEVLLQPCKRKDVLDSQSELPLRPLWALWVLVVALDPGGHRAPGH